jgi:release factor glutamine methyltransferase
VRGTCAAELLAASSLPRIDARALLAHVLGVARETLVAHPELAIAADAAARFDALAVRRRTGEPLAYLTGQREFYGRSFIVTPDVLIPRPETELAVETALRAVAACAAPALADLGTGSGCVALTLALERPDAQIIATDVSPATLDVARRNATELGVGNVRFAKGSWFEALSGLGPFDLIVSNPPYVALDDPHLADLRHEPEAALTAGRDGLDCLRTIIDGAAAFLRPGGALVVEHGCQQDADVRAIFLRGQWSGLATFADLADQPRVTMAHCNEKAAI